ncbi:glycosyltransferase family 4 protein [Vampirovibrio sp.]|uniref:glycosyltransferase family 4 protein n=1 Tax=Vampirovibrio sp. TaxID=2717857 RepID=UPI00359382DD
MTKPLIQVLQLISSLEVGGAEKLLLDLLAASRNFQQVQFTVVIMNQAVNPELRQRLQSMNLNVYFLDRPEGHKHIKYLLALLRIVRSHQVDIIHCHNGGSKLWAVLCKLLKPSLKLVFTVHDTIPAHYSGLQKWVHQTFIDQHIAISKSVAALCQREGLWPYTQIYNGIDLSPFRNAHRLSLVERLQKRSFQDYPLQIVQVGRLYYPKKGQDLLIKAIYECKQAGLNIQAKLMGGVYEYSQESYQALQKMVASLGLDSEIEFLVNRTDVPEVLRQADLFVLPSRYEGLGLVVLEAMAGGVPVIASNIDGPAELIEHDQTGLLFENDEVNSLVTQIRRIYHNPVLADGLSSAAAQFVVGFDIERMRHAYYQLYQSLMTPRFLHEKYSEPTVGEVLDGTSV